MLSRREVLMSADIGERFESRRMRVCGVLRIAAGITVEVVEERELNGDAVGTGARTVPGAVTRMTSRFVDVDRIVPVLHQCAGLAAHLGKDC